MEFEHHWGTRARVIRGTKCGVYNHRPHIPTIAPHDPIFTKWRWDQGPSFLGSVKTFKTTITHREDQPSTNKCNGHDSLYFVHAWPWLSHQMVQMIWCFDYQCSHKAIVSAIIFFIFFQIQNLTNLLFPSPISLPRPSLLEQDYTVSFSTPYLFLSCSFLVILVQKNGFFLSSKH